MSTDAVRKALGKIDAICEQLKPFKRRDLMGLVLKSANINEHDITLRIYALGGASIN